MQSVGKRRCALEDISNAPKKQMLNYYTDTMGVEESVFKALKQSEKAKNANAAQNRKPDVEDVPVQRCRPWMNSSIFRSQKSPSR
jgi:hypothetical protein